MSIKQRFNRSINHVGTAIKFKKSNIVLTVFGSAQPQFNNKDNTDSLGYSMASLFNVYLCSEENAQKLNLADFIYIDGRELKITCIEPIFFSNEILYYKAIAQLCREGVYID